MAGNVNVSCDFICKIGADSLNKLVTAHVNNVERLNNYTGIICDGQFCHCVIDKTIKVVIRYPERVISCSVSESRNSNENISVWVLTDTGQLYVNSLPLQQSLLSRCGTDKEAEVDGADSIFHDLLGEVPSSNAEVNIDKLPCFVQYAKQSDIKLQLCGARSVLTAKDFVVVLVQNSNSQHINVYKKSQLEIMKYDLDKCPIQPLTIFSNHCKPFKLRTGEHFMFSVFSEDEEEEIWRNKCCYLQKKLYNALFNVENNLLGSPIVLIGFPTGHIYAYPLKSYSGSTNPDGQLICDLRQELVAVHGVRISEETMELQESHDISNNLVFVGIGGRVLIATYSESDGVEFQEINISSGVLTSAVYGQYLVYSTQSGLFATDLTKIKTPTEMQQSTVTINMTGIRIIQPFYTQLGLASTQGVELLVVTLGGQVLHLQQDLSGYVDQSAKTTLTSESGSKKMKDLLTSIGKVSDQLMQKQKKVSDQRIFLEQVALAGCLISSHPIARLYNSNQRAAPTKEEEVISTAFRVITRNLGSKLEYSLSARVTNHSIVTLNSMWRFIVTLSSRNEGTRDNKMATKPWHTMQMVSITKIEKDAYEEICIDLPDTALGHLPLTVVPILSFHVPEGISDDDSSTTLPIPLPGLVIDILHMLAPLHTRSVSQKVSVEKQLLALASQRPVYKISLSENKSQSCDESEVSAAGHYSCSLQLRPNCIKPILKSNKDKIEEIRVLQYLLNGNEFFVDIEKPQVKARSPCGHQVALSVQRSSSTAGDTHLTVTIQAPTISMLNLLRSAIARRIEDVVAGHDCHHTISSRDLRKVAHNVQDIKQSIRDLQEAGRQQNQTYRVYEKLRNLALPK